MKKVLSLLLCLLLLSGLLFAAEGRIGVTLAPQWLWNTATEADDGETNFLFMAEGANYFGKEGGFGVEYGLGVNFPINTWAGDLVNDDPSSSSAFVFKAGLGYKYAFSDLFGLSAGVGVMGSIRSYSDGGSWGGVTLSGKSTAFVMDLYGNIAADITLLDLLGINVGVIVGGPVLSTLTTTVDGSIGDVGGSHTETTDVDKQGIFVAPFVGVSFVY